MAARVGKPEREDSPAAGKAQDHGREREGQGVVRNKEAGSHVGRTARQVQEADAEVSG